MIIQHQSKLEHSLRIVQYYSIASPNVTVSPTDCCTPVLFIRHITLCMFESHCVQVARAMLNYTNTLPLENWDTLCIGVSHKLMHRRCRKSRQACLKNLYSCSCSPSFIHLTTLNTLFVIPSLVNLITKALTNFHKGPYVQGDKTG